MKICTKCLIAKPIDNFSKHRAVCKPCRSSINAARLKERYYTDPARKESLQRWKDENPDKVREYRAREYQNNRERYAANSAKWTENNRAVVRQTKRRYKVKRKAWELNGSFTQAEWNGLLDKYGHICLSCRRDDIPLTQDHVIPLSKGGSNTIENIQPLCGPCNSSKHTKTIDYRPSSP